MTSAAADGRSSSALRGLVLALALALVATLVLAAPSHAHTTLLGSNPSDGGELETAPSQVRLTFTEDLLPQFVVVQVQADGKQPRELEARAEGPVVTAEVPDAMRAADSGAASQWRVDYRVVAADGHPVTGSVAFDVQPEGATPRTTGPSASRGLARAEQGSRPTSASQGSAPAWLLVGLAALVLLPAAALLAKDRRGRDRRFDEPPRS